MAGLTIPTGYETQQTAIARRQKVAEMLQELAIQSANNQHMTSPLQAIASVFQAYQGHRLEKGADAAQSDLSSKIRDSYLGAYGQAQKDTEAVRGGAMTPTEWMTRNGSNPLLADQAKMMGAVEQNDLQRGGNITHSGSYTLHERDIPSAGPSLSMPDYDKPTLSTTTPDGQVTTAVNPVGGTAALVRQGLPHGGYPMSMNTPLPNNAIGAPGMPGYAPQPPALPGAAAMPGQQPPTLPGAPMPGLPPSPPGGNGSPLSPQEMQIYLRALEQANPNAVPGQ